MLQKFGDNYAKRIEKEKKKLEELNAKIKDVQGDEIKILKATDVHSGVRINLAKWMAQSGVAPSHQPVPHQVDDLVRDQPHLWRSLDLRAH